MRNARTFYVVANLVMFSLATIFFSCGLDNTETERQEVIDRLRTLGVAAEPLVPQIPQDSATAQQVTLTLHVATPTTDAVVVEPFRNPGRKGANVVLLEQQVTIDTTATVEQKIGSLRIIAFKASVNVPSEKYWHGARGGTVQYGFKISSGNRTEYVSGEFLAFRAGEAELEWKNPSVQIKFPEDSTALANGVNGEITMEISKSQSELIRPGWFVSSGEVEQRRGETTNWKPKLTGEQAIIATARGADSLGFAIKVVKVNSL
jgi:hypothetical protein